MLEELQKDVELFDERPYPKMDRHSEVDNFNEYIKKIDEYSKKVHQEIKPFVLLPEEKRKKYADYFEMHFKNILKADRTAFNLGVLGLIINILRKCLVVLDDFRAEVLEKYLSEFSIKMGEGAIELSNLFEIKMYLAEMYRIDGKAEEYNRITNGLKEDVTFLPDRNDEFLFEIAKNAIAHFKYEEAKDIVSKISENSSLEDQIRKAGFWKQLSENQKAESILNHCSADLAQMKLSIELFASLSGYLNLCYRYDNNAGRMVEKFSDDGCYDNRHNTRRIIIELQEELSQRYFNEIIEDNKVIPFNLNTQKTITYKFGGENLLYVRSFNFILAIDRLGLSIFNEQAQILTKAVEKIIASSPSAFWKTSLIIRTNNEKIIDQYMTRDMIQSFRRDDIKLIFEELMDLGQLFDFDKNYNYEKRIIGQKNIGDCLSRLCIFLSDDDIIKYIGYLSKLSQSEDLFFSKSDIKKNIRRIFTRFNSNIATKIQNIIFEEFGSEFHLARYFESIEINDDKKATYYNSAIIKTKNEDITKRDCGVSELLLLWKNQREDNYREKIQEAIWSQKKDDLPRTEIYYPFVWEKLPYPSNMNFSKLYYDYFEKDHLVRSVADGKIIGNNSHNSVLDFLNLYFSVSEISFRNCSKIKIDASLNQKMLCNLYDFIDNEKSLTSRENDIFGEKKEAQDKFELISELVALIYCNAFENKLVNHSFKHQIEKIQRLLESCKINIDALLMVKDIEKEMYQRCIERFENVITLKDNEKYSGIFTGLQCLLFHLELKNEQISQVDDSLISFIGAIKYFNIEHAKSIWVNFSYIVCRKYFEKEKFQNSIGKSIQTCLEMYRQSEGFENRHFLDGLYNCTTVLKLYYSQLLKNNISITEILEGCVAEAKRTENKELQNIWEL
ncbi:hypothetical protein [Acetobacterium malicum]|uniref:hypothetical protein n=1 Tax=Acetobacterium malicum TaxID=52692 RepID=UPI003593DB22